MYEDFNFEGEIEVISRFFSKGLCGSCGFSFFCKL